MRLNPHQINRLVRNIIEELEKDGIIQSKDEKTIYDIVSAVIIQNLKMEEELEKEAEMLIRKHSAGYHTDELNYDLLIKRAKYELAKKKGFKL
ncbi:MAG: DUF507 family protein [Proteobacteria bacterium]|nr:DUF507 family protein [Pseudomonadota bacterium]